MAAERVQGDGDAGGRPLRQDPPETPLPEGELRQAIEHAVAAIDWASAEGEPVSGEELMAALPQQIVGYRASGVASLGTRPGNAPVVVRAYADGDRLVRVKLTDTALAPDLREGLRSRLLVIGTESSGHQTGAVIGAAPGVIAFRSEAKVARAVALLDGRFLAEVVVKGARGGEDAERVIAALRAPKPRRKK